MKAQLPAALAAVPDRGAVGTFRALGRAEVGDVGGEGEHARQRVFGEVVPGGLAAVWRGVQQFGACLAAAAFVEIGGEGGVHQGAVEVGGGGSSVGRRTSGNLEDARFKSGGAEQ